MRQRTSCVASDIASPPLNTCPRPDNAPGTSSDQPVEQRRREPCRIDFSRCDELCQRLQRQQPVRRLHQGAAIAQGSPDFQRGGIEGEWGKLQHPRGRTELRIIGLLHRREMPWCCTSTPFGMPVEPEVYIT